MKTVLQLKDGIWKIYNKIGCNTPANRELLGEEGVNTENMMQYLGIVEQRTNEILQMYAAAQATAKGEASTSPATVIACTHSISPPRSSVTLWRSLPPPVGI